jgi:hypothetical protein
MGIDCDEAELLWAEVKDFRSASWMCFTQFDECFSHHHTSVIEGRAAQVFG